MPNILSAIIFDDSHDKSLLNLVKTELGIYNVKKYANSTDTLEAIKNFNNVNLIFIDYETTLSRTFSFIKSAKDTGNCEESKFFLMANESNQDFLSDAAKNGVSAFILKPFSDKRLIKKAKKLLPVIVNNKKENVNLLGSVEAMLRFKDQRIMGTIEDISGDGCTITTLKFGRMGAEVYDIVTIKIHFGDEKLGINAEVLKIEQNLSGDNKSITTSFKFKNPNAENALQFAKFWAYILDERED